MSWQTIYVLQHAPAKPARGQACNGCGVCCLSEPCPLGIRLFGTNSGPCPGVRYDGVRYICGPLIQPEDFLPKWPRWIYPLVRAVIARQIAAGIGCDSDAIVETSQSEERTFPMSLSMYDITVPVFARVLTNLSAILEKGQANAEARKIDPSILINMRLAPDMFPLSRQIQIATDGAKGCVARLAGVDIPVFEDTEKTFDELRARISRTIDFLKTFERAQLDGTEEKTVILKIRGEDTQFVGLPYVQHFVQPNLYFHTSIAYGILRHAGVDLGKKDFLGPM